MAILTENHQPRILTQSAEGYRCALEPFILADFGPLRGDERVVDLGCGNGVLALLLAAEHRDMVVDGIEIQPRLAAMARRNVAANGWQQRLRIHLADMQEAHLRLGRQGHDVSVGNPPYWRLGAGRLNPQAEKAAARHELRITLDGFLASVKRLLKHGGRLLMIYHPSRLDELLAGCRARNLAPKRLRLVHGKAGDDACMALLEGVCHGRPALRVEPPLVLCGDDGAPSQELRRIEARFRP